MAAIASTREKIDKVQKSMAGTDDKGKKQQQLQSLRRRLEQLMVLADINDPLVKKRFEDGLSACLLLCPAESVR